METLADTQELGRPASFGLAVPDLGELVAVEIIALRRGSVSGADGFSFNDDPLVGNEEELVYHFSDFVWEAQKASWLGVCHASLMNAKNAE